MPSLVIAKADQRLFDPEPSLGKEVFFDAFESLYLDDASQNPIGHFIGADPLCPGYHDWLWWHRWGHAPEGLLSWIVDTYFELYEIKQTPFVSIGEGSLFYLLHRRNNCLFYRN